MGGGGKTQLTVTDQQSDHVLFHLSKLTLLNFTMSKKPFHLHPPPVVMGCEMRAFSLHGLMSSLGRGDLSHPRCADGSNGLSKYRNKTQPALPPACVENESHSHNV